MSPKKKQTKNKETKIEEGKRGAKALEHAVAKREEDKSKIVELDPLDEKNPEEDDGSRLLKDSNLPKFQGNIIEEPLPPIKKLASEVGEVLARKYGYRTLFSAARFQGGYEVFGWLEINYPNFYNLLIDNRVLDIACHFSKKEANPDTVIVVTGVKLDDYEMTGVQLSKECRLINYPTLPFNRIIVLAEEHFEKAVTWIENYPWSMDNYDTVINLGPVNLALIGFALWNRPVFMVLQAPGKSKGIFKAKISSKKIREKIVSVREKLIHYYRTSIDRLESKIDELEREAKQWKEMYSDLEKEQEYKLQRAKLRQELSISSNGSQSSLFANKYLIIGIIAVLSILAIIGVVL